MLKLYFSPSTSSLATHIALIEAGAEFKLEPRLLSKQQTRTPDYLAINPDGKVPALVTNSGRVLTEVAVDALLHRPQVSRRKPLARRRYRRRGGSDLMDVVHGVDDARLARQGPRACRQCLRRRQRQARRPAMGDRPFHDRRHPSVPGLLAVPSRHRSGTGTYPALEAHHDRMLARPSVQKALAAEKGYE